MKKHSYTPLLQKERAFFIVKENCPNEECLKHKLAAFIFKPIQSKMDDRLRKTQINIPNHRTIVREVFFEQIFLKYI